MAHSYHSCGFPVEFQHSMGIQQNPAELMEEGKVLRGGEGSCGLMDGGGEWWTDGGEESDGVVRWGWKVMEGEGWGGK